MTSVLLFREGAVITSAVTDVPEFGRNFLNEIAAIERLSTEPVGTMTLTLTNVVVGSRYRIERQGDGSLATPTGNAEGVAASSTVAITLDYYSGGSANNDLRIKVRKGSGSPYYKDFETLVTIGAAAQSVYIAQISDE